MLNRSIAKGPAVVCAGLLLAGCESSTTEVPPPPPLETYSLTIQRAPLETIAGVCTVDVASQPFVGVFQEDDTVLRMEVINRFSPPWQGSIDAEGNFQLSARDMPPEWNAQSWTARGTLSADRTTLTGIEEWRGGGGEDFCHAMVGWSAGAG